LKVLLRRAFRHPITLLKSMGSFSLAHHPECQAFDHHCIRLRGHRLCIGCFIGYPVFAISLASLFVLSFMGVNSFLGIRFASLDAFLLGAALQATVLVGKVLHTTRVSVKVVFKCVQAIGLAFVFFPALIVAVPILVKTYLLFMLWTAFNAITGATKMYEIGKTCSSCRYKSQWSQCPGFKRTLDKLYEAGFLIK
jgi:hypothetical protein